MAAAPSCCALAADGISTGAAGSRSTPRKTFGRPDSFEGLVELEDEVVRRWQDETDALDRERGLGIDGHRRDEAGREDPAHQPHDQDGLAGTDEAAADAIKGAQDARPEERRRRPPGPGADQLAEADEQHQRDQDRTDPNGRDDVVEVRETSSGITDDGRDRAGSGADEAADLGERPGPRSEDDGDHEQRDGDRVERVHLDDRRTDPGLGSATATGR